MKATRLVSILLLLQTRGRLTARQLADALEVSVRTVYRDVESLGAAGVPVYGEPGHDGGYRLLDGYRTRLTGLTEGEADSLFLAGLPAAAADLGLAGPAAAAQLKLMAALPEALRERAGRVAERFHLDAPAWYRADDETPHLATVADAVWHQRALRVRYLRWARPHEVSRTIRPYGLVLKAGTWYLVADGDKGPRTYRMSRLLDVQQENERFERAEGFDLAGYWRGYLERFDQRRYRARATLRLSPAAFDDLDGLLEPSAAKAARNTAGEPGADGWRRVTIPIESTEYALPELLRLGADAEVIDPPELRDRLVGTLDAARARYYCSNVGSGRTPTSSTSGLIRPGSVGTTLSSVATRSE
ncbi:helix-turn-helix transcriptional regulator [Pseudonocardia acaciae]|uniref:helix-turn-helix transcriptional regulator n=1 Tax=Pseudonocardia acaciae TaxID=551276 RepID=UPI0007E8C1FF|nr:YafY family protein [Pseudonocardia acaciae]